MCRLTSAEYPNPKKIDKLHFVAFTNCEHKNKKFIMMRLRIDLVLSEWESLSAHIIRNNKGIGILLFFITSNYQHVYVRISLWIL